MKTGPCGVIWKHCSDLKESKNHGLLVKDNQ